MRVYFLKNGDDPTQTRDLEARLRSAIPDVGTVNTLSEIPSGLLGNAGAQVCILMTGPANDRAYLDNFISVAGRNKNGIFFILISDEISATDYKRLVQSGGADWVSSARAPQEILEILRKPRFASSQSASPAATEPTVITFVPSAGGVGNSKLLVEVGVWLKSDKASRNRRIALIDLDFQTSHVCSYLDMEPKFRIEEIVSSPDRLDAQLFDIFRSRHSSGLDVIAAPRSKFDPNDLSVDALDILFEMASDRYDLILIDLPVTWFGWTNDIVFNSDSIVVTGLNTVPCLHQIVETLAVVRKSRTDPIPLAVVLNRCRSGLLGGIAGQKHVQRVLGREKIFYIHDHASEMTESINIGAPLIGGYGGRKFRRELSALARDCAQVKSLRPRAQGKKAAAMGRPPSQKSSAAK